MGSYVPGTEQERTEMLREIGFESIEQLFAHIPEEVKSKGWTSNSGRYVRV